MCCCEIIWDAAYVYCARISGLCCSGRRSDGDDDVRCEASNIPMELSLEPRRFMICRVGPSITPRVTHLGETSTRHG